MSYVLGGANSESDGFTAAIANFALRAVHESQGLVTMTNVVQPTQGNQFLIPKFAPITFQDYNPAGSGGDVAGDADEQNPAMAQSTITATPAVAATGFDVFLGFTTSFQLAATLGAEIGEAFAEKVDQRVAAAFTSFKATKSHTMYAASADGFTRVSALGAIELLPAGATAANAVAGFQSASVLGAVRNVKQAFKTARLPGNPVIVLDSNGASTGGSAMNRLLGELTGGAVAQSGGADLSALGNELLTTGQVTNVYGCQVVFSSFLPTSVRTVDGVANTSCLVGAYFSSGALYTVMKEGLMIKTGEAPGGLKNWVTGLGYFGAGVGDGRRGGAINISQL